MKIAVAIILALFLSTPALAEQVLVSFGNTQTSTRIVLTFESPPKWTSSQSSRRLDLSFDESGHFLDQAEALNAAAGPRIEKVETDDSGARMTFTFSCDCTADVYPFGSGSLIVEVRDGLAQAPVESVQDSAPAQPPIPKAAAAEPQDIAATTQPNKLTTPKPLARTEGAKHPPVVDPALPWPTLATPIELPGIFEFPLQSETESQAVAMLSRELSRAASQGLVAPQSDPQPFNRSGHARTGTSYLDEQSNIKIVTSLDRATSTHLGRHPPTPDGNPCIPDSDVDLADWGGTLEISTIGILRGAAYAENGDIRPDGARDLARFYIALGFGSEASAAARFMQDGAQKDLILALAEIVDHGASASPVLKGQIFCRGQVALWAALAGPIDKSVSPDSMDIVLSTFSALAPHQRAHLGPVLAERLREVGFDDEARNAVNAVARGGLQSNESELVTARLELGGTRPDKARDTLVEISNGTDVTAAEALLELLEDAERREMAPNPEWVEDAPSLARATEGNEVAEALNLAGLRGRIALGQFDELRHALAEDTPGLNATTRDILARMALVKAARHADDEEFLRSEVGLPKLARLEDMPNSERFEVAQRLLGIGLPARALPYISGEPGSNDELQTLVRVLTATGQSDQAISVLSARDEPEASVQLGQVLSQSGGNDQAIQAFEEGGSLEDAALSAIRAGDWNWIAEREIAGQSGSLSEAARKLASPSDVEPESVGETGEPANGRLITSSQELRRHAATLLSETDLLPGGPAFTN